MNTKEHHHLDLLCDVSELATLLVGSENIENFLQRSVEMVARHMNANVCSICGELAHDSRYIPSLLGIGIRALSVYPKFLPSVQKTICNLKLSDAESYAKQLLAKNSIKGAAEVLQRLTNTFGFNESGWRVQHDQ